MSKRFSIEKRIKSFRYALQGVKTLLLDEHNARIHLALAVIAIILGFYFQISTNEWLAIVIVIGLVLGMEAINSAIERTVDLHSTEQKPELGRIKDLAAAGVLFTAISALTVGLIIFIPKILGLFNLA